MTGFFYSSSNPIIESYLKTILRQYLLVEDFGPVPRCNFLESKITHWPDLDKNSSSSSDESRSAGGPSDSDSGSARAVSLRVVARWRLDGTPSSSDDDSGSEYRGGGGPSDSDSD